VSATSPEDLKQQLASGLLAFPATHFDAALAFDEEPFRAHIDNLVESNPAALFAAGGAGEFFSLTLIEFSHVIAAAVEQTRGRVPVVAGCGYGTAMAIEFAHAAEAAGADGLLLMPPYLVKAGTAGLAAHVEAVCAATKLGVVFYNRDNAILDENALAELCDAAPNLIGFKDGVGDIESMRRICARFRGRLTTICGMPTAESFAMQYFELGASTYSSAIFSFLPGLAQRFYAAARRGDRETVAQLTSEFVAPYVEIRKRRPGYAVSIMKAGLRAMDHPAGSVRPPLTDLTEEEMEALKTLVAGRS
jgi:5-dehydro-4-deoxyglucarate dehydratase